MSISQWDISNAIENWKITECQVNPFIFGWYLETDGDRGLALFIEADKNEGFGKGTYLVRSFQ